MGPKSKNQRGSGSDSDIGSLRPFSTLDSEYALTVTPNKRDRVYMKEDIDKKVKMLKRNNDRILSIDILSYEIKKCGTLHAHCLVLIKGKKYFKYPEYKGWQFYFKPLTNKEGWLNYCKKHAYCEAVQNQILYEHMSRNMCMFDDSTESCDIEDVPLPYSIKL